MSKAATKAAKAAQAAAAGKGGDLDGTTRTRARSLSDAGAGAALAEAAGNRKDEHLVWRCRSTGFYRDQQAYVKREMLLLISTT